MKKHLLLLLAALLPMLASAYDAKINGIYYNFSGNEATVTYNEKAAGTDYSGTIIIPESVNYSDNTYNVTKIGDFAFYNCEGVTSIILPSNITNISTMAFCNCTSLVSINLPESIKIIDAYAFASCSGLTSINIPSGVTTIGVGAFGACTGLNSIIIPESVTTIGNSAFSDCTGELILKKYPIPAGEYTGYYHEGFDGVKCSPILSGSKFSSIKVNGFVGNYAFANLSTLQSVEIGENGGMADSAFYDCTATTLILNCTLREGNYNSSFLKGTLFKNITVNTETIPKYSFSGLGMTSLELGEKVKVIGEGALLMCSMLSSIIIPSSVTIIGEEAFRECHGLTSICIPNSMTEIGTRAFYDCISTNTVISSNPVPPPCAEDAFGGLYGRHTYDNSVLYVPKGSINLYKATSPWSSFKDIQPITTKNTLTYIVDGEIYKSYEIEYNATITPEAAPTKEGYTFSGWSEIPETMPDHDVTVTGSFIGNDYTLTYIVDGQVYKAYTVACGAVITPEDTPTKEGYTFSGWTYIPPTMPATDVVVMGTFTINSYTLTYMVDGEEYKTSTLVYGSEIIPEEEPNKEGYTFSGWSEIPENMPAGDVVVTGSFIPNSYTLSYIVDGEEYKTASVTYGTAITPEAEPIKEGYTFSGWSEIPNTMPAEDVTVTGSFTINQYLLTYILEGEEYKSYEIDFNTALTPEPVPTKKGMTFSGWGDVPETMPAHDVTLTGSYTWSKEVVDGVVYQVADTLSNYASVVGYEGTGEEVTILSDVLIGEDVYAVNNIAENTLPKTTTIYVSVGRLLLWLWTNGYEKFRDRESGRYLPAPEISLEGKTASSLSLSYKNDYPEFSESITLQGSPVEKGKKGYDLALTGLEPDKLYEGLATLTLTYEDASYSKSFSFKTEPLTLTTQQPKIISLGNVIVAATSNLDDAEMNVGFEWRRTDWTDEFASNFGIAYLYKGTMEGYIRNLYTERLWKYRPYYESNDGNRYYGNWVGIDPTNISSSYFMPTVHTYSRINLTGNLAKIWGYVMRGTDNITMQGFIYWSISSTSSSRRNANGIPSDATKVLATGNVMSATLEDLDYDTEYCYMAFVTTSEGETFYGEPQTFKTSFDPDGIENVMASEEVTEVARYDIQGRMISKPQKGINIIRYSDGTTRKVIVKQ